MKRRKWYLVFSILAVLVVGQTAGAESVKMTTQGVTDDEIVLGAHVDLSGPTAPLGVEFKSALLLAVEEINEKGGIHGRKLRLIIEDSGYDPKKAVLATQKLLTKDKIFAMIFSFGTPTSLASMPLVLGKGIPFFPGSSHKKFFPVPVHPLVFNLTLPETVYMKVGLRYAIETFNLKNVGAIYQNDDFGEGTIEGAQAALKKYNLKAAIFVTAGNIGDHPRWEMEENCNDRDEVVMTGSDLIELEKEGFETCDTEPPYFELMVLKFNKNAKSPEFSPNSKKGICDNKKGFTFIHSNQCPFMEEYVGIMTNVLKKKNFIMLY